MAKTRLDQDLFDRMRAAGVRKQVAERMAEASHLVQRQGKKVPKPVRRTVKDLRSALSELEDRVAGGPAKRSAAAKKAARTRKRKAEARSSSAKKAARTRARAKS
jgi:primase-polymerase (primpol)-like protein